MILILTGFLFRHFERICPGDDSWIRQPLSSGSLSSFTVRNERIRIADAAERNLGKRESEQKWHYVNTSGLYYKHILTILSDACTINVLLVFALAFASVINYARK